MNAAPAVIALILSSKKGWGFEAIFFPLKVKAYDESQFLLDTFIDELGKKTSS